MSPGLLFFLAAACAAWVYWDAWANLPPRKYAYPRREWNALTWAAGTLVFWIAVFPLYLWVRFRRRG